LPLVCFCQSPLKCHAAAVCNAIHIT
jgi:hypothetical protein